MNEGKQLAKIGGDKTIKKKNGGYE